MRLPGMGTSFRAVEHVTPSGVIGGLDRRISGPTRGARLSDAQPGGWIHIKKSPSPPGPSSALAAK